MRRVRLRRPGLLASRFSPLRSCVDALPFTPPAHRVDRRPPCAHRRAVVSSGVVTPADYARARRVLLRGDAVLAGLIKRHGPCGLAAAQRADHFSALVRAITNQQLSTKAAATIYGRLAALMPGGTPTPEGLAALTDEQLRAVGYSRQKIGYLRDLAAHVLDAPLDLDAIEALPDDEVIDEADAGQGHRTLVGGDVPDVPAAPAGRPAGRRPGHRQRDQGAVPAAEDADARAHPADRARPGSRTDRWPAGTCGGASTTSREAEAAPAVCADEPRSL